ncbi:site-specific integrase [Dactylosporangium maewongense]|uniref:Site-specific integrase n=1 Tax=Dactylosporangium maewongense TaxID=634393 RepID=A0ABP4NN24_9ACTN
MFGITGMFVTSYRPELAEFTKDRTGWVVVGADDYVLHHEGSLFIAGLREAGRAYNTERTYAGRTALFLSYCALQRLEWARVTVWQLARFLHWLVETPLPSRVRGGGGPDRFRDANTASAIVGTVCEFLRFGVRMGWVEPELLGQLTEPCYLRFLPVGFDPGEGDQRRTVRSRLIKFASVDAGIEWLTVEQVARLVDVTRHARDRFLVLLLWCTGIRIGEALGLHREDMHLLADSQSLGCQVKGPHVHVRRRLNSNGAWAKSRRPRVVPVTSELGVCYADYLHERAMVPQAEGTMQVLANLFREPLGRAMSYSSVKGLFDRLAQRSNLIARPHMLRHGAATEWIRQGTDRAVVKELLGHVSDSSMNVYIHVPDGAKRAAVERADARRREVTR